jgi:hypothetical protein
MKVKTIIFMRTADAVESLPLIGGAHELPLMKAKFGAGAVHEREEMMEVDPETEWSRLASLYGEGKDGRLHVERAFGPEGDMTAALSPKVKKTKDLAE